jgi:MFS family permease
MPFAAPRPTPMHIPLPALPFAAADFGVSRGMIQLAITLYLFRVASGQLPCGPVSDKFGRRPTPPYPPPAFSSPRRRRRG